jgi:hypothetical protein
LENNLDAIKMSFELELNIADNKKKYLDFLKEVFNDIEMEGYADKFTSYLVADISVISEKMMAIQTAFDSVSRSTIIKDTDLALFNELPETISEELYNALGEE